MAAELPVAVIGAGGRGFTFAGIFRDEVPGVQVTAVAEPRQDYREEFAKRFGVPTRGLFSDWRELAASPGKYDAVVISTPDRLHAEAAVAFTKRGCHMLLEKPMATSLEDCRRIARAQEEAGTVTCVCHSLRYNAGFAKLKEVAASGRIGRVVTIDQLEQVAWWHQAHSFVRGNWGNEGRSTFMLMAKSCHDIDYIAHLAGAGCRQVASHGGIAYFTRDNAPASSGERCTACAVEAGCPYSAFKRYVDTNREAWPAAVASLDHSREAHLRAIAEGPYGRCVWKCDNDVVDHQVVCMDFDGGITATFTMTAFTQEGGRKIRVHGTEGEVEFTEEKMWVRTFADGRTEQVVFPEEKGGHGGGDARVAASFLAAIREGNPSLVLTDVQESLRTHTIVFAAEQSRRQGRMVRIEDMA